MREILFRGKMVGNGEWVEGSLTVDHYDHAGKLDDEYRIVDTYYGVDDENFPTYQSGLDEAVVQSTIGQYTGLTDKTGKKIFEGDICLIEIPRIDGLVNRHICRCEFEDGCFVFVSNEEDYWCRGNDYGYHDKARENIKVIGNIHDNLIVPTEMRAEIKC